jgi:hypothetical protein
MGWGEFMDFQSKFGKYFETLIQKYVLAEKEYLSVIRQKFYVKLPSRPYNIEGNSLIVSNAFFSGSCEKAKWLYVDFESCTLPMTITRLALQSEIDEIIHCSQQSSEDVNKFANAFISLGCGSEEILLRTRAAATLMQTCNNMNWDRAFKISYEVLSFADLKALRGAEN